MVKKILLLAGVALAVPAFAQTTRMEQQKAHPERADVRGRQVTQIERAKAQMNDGSVKVVRPAKAPAAKTQWKRPAGQFWGVGYDVEQNQLGYYFTPLVIRPWTEYTFENISTVQGVPTWDVMGWSSEQDAYVTYTSDQTNVTEEWSYLEYCDAPVLSYPSQRPYPSQFRGLTSTANPQTGMSGIFPMCATDNISTVFGATMPVSSHVWGPYTREPVSGGGMLYYTGAKVYEGMDEEDGCWFGTNNSGINAIATRFEKPDQPYLMNAVYFYYRYFQDIPKEIPLKAYVFKTVNDAKVVQVNDSVTREQVELGELIATAEASIAPATFVDRVNYENAAKFEFFETNPVTGAKTAISLEIEDDITVVVTGFNVDLGNGGLLTTAMSTDTFDEGYGNLGFLGSFEMNDEGIVTYGLTAFKDFFDSPMPNTTLGVLADVTYPWLVPNAFEQPNDVHLPNEDPGVEGEQGLQYILALLASTGIEDWEITFNGEESCDWFGFVDAMDDVYENEETGEIFYTGLSMVLFQAAPNPENVDRTCVVEVTIPAAKYTITFRQGSNNTVPDAVEVVSVDTDAQYFDLQGRRVVNPEKGLYIKKTGNTTKKVIL